MTQLVLRAPPWTRRARCAKLGAMATSAAHRNYTLDEFVKLEEYANVRHEWVDGQIFAMAGGTPEHGTYAANVIGC